ncbi:MAG: hypothetical protein WBC91_06375 [Phototrophicaceae bacterium]
MRLLTFIVIIMWGLIACSTTDLAPQPLPTGSAIELTVDDTEIKLVTTTGWQTFSANDHIVLSYVDESLDNVVVNIWLPDMDMTNYETITDAIFDVASRMEDDQNLFVTQPTTTRWNGYEAVYFFVGDEANNNSMILVSQIDDETIFALNIRGITENFTALQSQLSETFATLTINDQLLGNDVFATLPDNLILAPRNPEAAVGASSEP